MLVGVSTAALFEKLGVEGAFKMLSEAGCTCVDFGFDVDCPLWKVARGETDNVFSLDADKLVEHYRPHKEAADKYGVKIHQAHAPFPSYMSQSPEASAFALEAIKKCFPILKMMDCKYLIVHPAFNGYNDRMEYDDEWDLNIRMYSELIPFAKKYGVTVCLENMFVVRERKIYGACCSDPNEAAAYVDELNDIAGQKCFAFCYDTGHSLLIGQDAYLTLKTLGDRVETLHVHDNDGWDDQHVPPYTGRLDWDRLLEGLKAIDYNGAMTLEIGTLSYRYPVELLGDAYRLAAAEGHYFARRLGK